MTRYHQILSVTEEYQLQQQLESITASRTKPTSVSLVSTLLKQFENPEITIQPTFFPKNCATTLKELLSTTQKFSAQQEEEHKEKTINSILEKRKPQCQKICLNVSYLNPTRQVILKLIYVESDKININSHCLYTNGMKLPFHIQKFEKELFKDKSSDVYKYFYQYIKRNL